MIKALERTDQEETPEQREARIDAAVENAKRFGEMDPHRQAIGADIARLLADIDAPARYAGLDAAQASQAAESAARAERLKAALPPMH